VKKKLKLIVILLVVIVAGGFGAMKFLGGDGPGNHEPETAYVPLDLLFAPVVREREIRGYVLLSLQLELADSYDLNLVHLRMAPLRDAFIRDLHTQALLRRSGEPSVNVYRVKKRFMLISERVMGAGVVIDVLIQSAMERRT
jgi:hypothetical protein